MELLRPGGQPASPSEPIGPDPDGVQEGFSSFPAACDCGWEGQTSAPQGSFAPGRWECPSCGACWYSGAAE